MTHTVTLLTNHKGFSRSKVTGEEYVVDALVDITSYTSGGEVINASSLGLSRINAVTITGQKGVALIFHIEIDDNGKYASTSSFQIKATTVVDGTEPAPEVIGESSGDVEGVRVRVFGIL